MKIAMLGAGAWATAIASVLADNGHEVVLWCHDDSIVGPINDRQCNTRYMPNIPLSKNITASAHLSEVMDDVEWVFSCTPVQYLRNVLQLARQHYTSDQQWVVLSKGVEQESLKFPVALHQEILSPDMRIAVVGGPSFAYDVLQHEPTGVVAASEDYSLAASVRMLMSTDYFMVENSSDIIGVQAGGAFKNVLSLLIGMADGAGYQENTKALLFTKAFQELVRVSQALGAEQKTLYGLSGIGDSLLTAQSTKSRNTQVGYALGKGLPLSAILTETGYTPEGVNTAASICEIAQKHSLVVPLLSGAFSILSSRTTIKNLVESLIKS